MPVDSIRDVQRADVVITQLHRLERRSLQRFEDAIFLLVSRGIWDLDELDARYERRQVAKAVRRERRRSEPAQPSREDRRTDVGGRRALEEEAVAGRLVGPRDRPREPVRA